MPAALDPFKVAVRERSNYAKFDGLLNTGQASLNAVGDQAQNQWGSGQILAPSQLSQGGASSGQALVWNGIQWLPTTVKSRAVFTNTTTRDVVNTTNEVDLFTGATIGAGVGLAVFPSSSLQAGTIARVACGGDYLNSSGGSHDFTLRFRITRSTSSGNILWGGQTVSSFPSNANRRAWHLRGTVMNTDVTGTADFVFNGVYAMADTQAATTGLGPLRPPANLRIMTPIHGEVLNLLLSNDYLLAFSCEHDAAHANLSMRCTYARIERTN